MAERDRDESGRPRSTRPRDALGRPLPHGSEGVLRIPDDLELPPAETLAYAQDLLDRGLAFNAHEVLEAAWKNGPDDERMLWQGLAQLAVGITHIQRGNVKGAITLLRRASARLAQDDRPAPYAIDAAHLVAYADALIADLAAGAEIPPKRLRPRLVGRRTPIAWGLLRTRGAAQLIVEDDAERRDVVRAAASDAERDPTEIASPVRRRIERAVRLVVLNFLRLGQQVAVALRLLRRPLYVAGESADGIHRWLPAQRDDLGAIVVQIANRNQRAEIAWRRTVVGEAGVADVGDVFVGQLAAKLALP